MQKSNGTPVFNVCLMNFHILNVIREISSVVGFAMKFVRENVIYELLEQNFVVVLKKNC